MICGRKIKINIILMIFDNLISNRFINIGVIFVILICEKIHI